MQVWQRLTIRARRAVVLAHDEALGLEAPLISTGHLLMGTLRLGEGTALDLLRHMGVSVDRLTEDLREHLAAEGAAAEPPRELAFTPEAQRVLHVAYAEAERLKHGHVGTEHLLIGLLHEGRGAASRLLRKHDVDLTRVRQGIAGNPPGPAGGRPEAYEGT